MVDPLGRNCAEISTRSLCYPYAHYWSAYRGDTESGVGESRPVGLPRIPIPEDTGMGGEGTFDELVAWTTRYLVTTM